MIWLVWRQYRTAVLTGLVLLILILILSLLYNGLGIVLSYVFSVQICICLCFWIGMFLGAPLVTKEQEQRTHYFVWTQSITRKRWLAVKLSLLSGATALAFGAYMLLIALGNKIMNVPFSLWNMYEGQGIVPIGYALFGLILGVAIGTFVRRTTPAMLLTFVTLSLLFIVLHNGYPYLVPPKSKTFVLNANSNEITDYMYSEDVPFMPIFSRNLILSSKFTNQQGNKIISLTRYCGIVLKASEQNKCINKAQADNLHFMVVYQPAERFWLIQGIETGILLVITGVLVPLIFWGIRKRVS